MVSLCSTYANGTPPARLTPRLTTGPASPAAVFNAVSNMSVGLYSITTTTRKHRKRNLHHEASTFVPDLIAPLIRVTSVDTRTNLQRRLVRTASVTRLSAVNLFVVWTARSNGVCRSFPPVPGGTRLGDPSLSRDGISHSYRFYSLGTNGNNIQQSPSVVGRHHCLRQLYRPLQSAGHRLQRGPQLVDVLHLLVDVSPTRQRCPTSLKQPAGGSQFALDGTGSGIDRPDG